jgi:hypothetical protein
MYMSQTYTHRVVTTEAWRVSRGLILSAAVGLVGVLAFVAGALYIPGFAGSLVQF